MPLKGKPKMSVMKIQASNAKSGGLKEGAYYGSHNNNKTAAHSTMQMQQ